MPRWVRYRREVFGPGFYCDGGSFFCTLRFEAVRYVRDYARVNPETLAYFRRFLAPEMVEPVRGKAAAAVCRTDGTGQRES